MNIQSNTNDLLRSKLGLASLSAFKSNFFPRQKLEYVNVTFELNHCLSNSICIIQKFSHKFSYCTKRRDATTKKRLIFFCFYFARRRDDPRICRAISGVDLTFWSSFLRKRPFFDVIEQFIAKVAIEIIDEFGSSSIP